MADDKKAEQLLILDIRKQSAFTDYFVICSGTSLTHVQAIADNVLKEMGNRGEQAWHKEGYAHGQWVVLDFIDVVVHIFDVQVRSFYDLEHLWQDAAFIRLDELKPRKHP